MPRFSILVTCYNAAEFIAEAIESLKGQTFGDFECLISEDCSTDGTYHKAKEAIGEDARIRVVRQDPNIGGGENLRYLMNHAYGEIMVEMGGDDFLASPDALARIHQEYLDHPNVEAVSGSFVIVPRGGVVNHRPPILWWKGWCFCKPLTWRREVGLRVLAELGEVVYDETGKVPRYGWDVSIYMPIVYLARSHRTIHDVLYAYREHEANDAKDHREDQETTEKRVCEWLDARLMPELNLPWLQKKPEGAAAEK